MSDDEYYNTIKVGDKVVISHGHGWSRSATEAVVDRVTATQIVIGSDRYRKTDGYRTGASRYSGPCIAPPSKAADLVKEMKLRTALGHLRTQLECPSVTPVFIERARKALDNVEAVLRNLGEWKQP